MRRGRRPRRRWRRPLVASAWPARAPDGRPRSTRRPERPRLRAPMPRPEPRFAVSCPARRGQTSCLARHNGQHMGKVVELETPRTESRGGRAKRSRRRQSKTALVLGGGGFTGGVYEIGALRALDLLAVNRTINEFDV